MMESARNMGGWPVSFFRRIHRMTCPMGHLHTDWHDSAEDAYKAWIAMCAWTEKGGKP